MGALLFQAVKLEDHEDRQFLSQPSSNLLFILK